VLEVSVLGNRGKYVRSAGAGALVEKMLKKGWRCKTKTTVGKG